MGPPSKGVNVFPCHDECYNPDSYHPSYLRMDFLENDRYPTGGMRRMAAASSHRGAVVRAVRTRFRDVLLMALLLAWFFDVRFTNQLFRFTDSVLASSVFSCAAIASAFVVALVLVVRPGVLDSPSWRRGLAAVLCALALAVGACAASFVPEDSERLMAYSIGMGAMVGACMACALALTTYRLRGCGVPAVVGMTTAAFVVAFSLVVAAMIVPYGLVVLILLCPCALAACLFGKRGYLGERDASRASRLEPAKGSAAPRLRLLLFVSSFLAVYLPAMFPKTTQLAPAYFETSVAGVSFASLAAFVLCGLLFAALSLLAARRKVNAAYVAIASMVLIAGIFFSMPFMNSSSVPFALMMSCAVVFVFSSYALVLSAMGDVRTREGRFYLLTCVCVSGSGASLAAVFAFVFLGPLYGNSFQDGLFVAIPAVLIILFLALFMAKWKDYLSLLGLGQHFASELDTSQLEDRCAAVARRCRLTKREREVLVLLGEGRNEPYVEQALSVSRATVKTHISHIYQKTGVASRQELIDLLRA